MATYKTPGVYIEERSVFGNSVVPVPTAVPAFVGYTERNEYQGRSIAGRPIKVTSLVEYISLFGGGFRTKYTVGDAAADTEPDVVLGTPGSPKSLTPDNRFYTYDSVRFFYANGGGDCYIVSIGTYADGQPPQKAHFETGIDALEKEEEITMILIPDALSLEDKVDYFGLINAKCLEQCLKLKSRVTVIDFYDGVTSPESPNTVLEDFRGDVGTNPSTYSYGVAYYPWLDTSVTTGPEVDARAMADKVSDVIKDNADLTAALETAVKAFDDATDDAGREDALPALTSAQNDLVNASADYKLLMDAIREKLNFLPPGPGMAGIMAKVDDQRGVWKAPANLGLNNVIKPRHKITNNLQDGMNMPLNGKAINAIRSFQGRGAAWVWGARTMDGNSNDWRYLNVRRLFLFLEQSVKAAAFPFVFEPNDANTWTTIRSMIENFLNSIWKQGGLVGPSPEAAYQVLVGLGVTMTAQDILEGYLRVTVKAAPSRPAEFIVITFEQKMQEA